MAGNRKLTVEVLGDAKGAVSALDKVGSSAGGMGSKLAGFGKMAAVGFLGAGTAAVAFGKSAIDAAAESAKVGKQTEAIIKATGGAANVTADQVGQLATKLSNLTGVDDELIQTSSNLLLTFKGVRNEVGAGNDVFNRASLAALDMGNVFGSADAAAMQLGKALDNPTKGIAALGKAGVQFTAEQKEQIATMQKSGDILGAQKIILAEVEAQVGGTAAATATNADRMKVAFGNLQEGVGAMLLPAMEKFAGVMSASVLPAVQRFADEQLPKIIAAAKPVAEWLGQNLPKAFEAVKTAITAVVTVVQTVWQKWGDDVLRIGGQVATWLQTNVPPAFEAVKNTIKRVVDDITRFWQTWGDDITRIARQAWDKIGPIVSGVITTIQGIITTFTGVISGDWSKVWDGMKTVVEGWKTQIVAIINAARTLLFNAAKFAFEGIESGARSIWASLKTWVMGLPGSIKSALGALGSLLYGVGQDIINGLVRGIKSKADDAKAAVTAVVNPLGWLARKIVDSKSPSKLFHEIGADITEGLANGILATEKFARQAITQVMNAVVRIGGDRALELAARGAGTDMGEEMGIGIAAGIKLSVKGTVAAVKGMAEEAMAQLAPILKWSVGHAQQGQFATGTGPNGETIQGRPFAANPDGSTMIDPATGAPIFADDTAGIGRVSAERFGTTAAATNVVVNVGGSVVTERDLVQTVRAALANGAVAGFGFT